MLPPFIFSVTDRPIALRYHYNGLITSFLSDSTCCSMLSTWMTSQCVVLTVRVMVVVIDIGDVVYPTPISNVQRHKALDRERAS